MSAADSGRNPTPLHPEGAFDAGMMIKRGDHEDFDTAAVPRYPMLRAEIRDDGTGEYTGVLEDEVLTTDADVQEVSAALITAAARQAGTRLGSHKAIRVRGHSPDGGVFALVVTGDGRVFETEDPAPPREVITRTKKGRRPRVETPDQPAGRRRPHPVLFLVLGAPVVMIAVVVWMLFFRGGETTEAPTPPAAKQLPVVAPAGYAPVASWAVPVGTTTGTEAGLAADEQRVYAPTGQDGGITAYDATNGLERWHVGLGSSLTAGPTLTTVAGREVVAASTGSDLVLLDPETGTRVGEWELNESMTQVRITATGPVVTGMSNTAQIVVDGDLVTRIMPAGAAPVAPGPDGSLIAATADRVYSSTGPRLSGAGVPIEATGEHEGFTVAGWTGDLLVLAYPVSSTTASGVRLSGYTAPSNSTGGWSRAWSTGMLATSPSLADETTLPLAAGPAGKWGVYGATVVNLQTGETAGLRGWSTTGAVGDEIAFGTTSASRVLSAGPAGLGGVSAAQPSGMVQAAAPQAVSGSSAFLLTADGGSDSWLYALQPTGGGGPR